MAINVDIRLTPYDVGILTYDIEDSIYICIYIYICNHMFMEMYIIRFHISIILTLLLSLLGLNSN